MQSLHSAITPAHLPFLARSPPWSPLLHLPCTRPSTTPPILQLSDFPTSRKAEKPTNRKVGKLASWHPLPGGGAPPRLTRPRRPTFRPCARYRSHFITPAPSLLFSYPRVNRAAPSALAPTAPSTRAGCRQPALTALCSECTLQSLHSAVILHPYTHPTPSLSFTLHHALPAPLP